MPVYHIERSITVDADLATVLATVADFSLWPNWSPWLCMEPDTKLTFEGKAGQVGHAYTWDGDMVGAGGITLTDVGDGHLEMDLHFLRPFKSSAFVAFDLEDLGGQTKITWSMDGKLPFFLFFMVDGFKCFIGSDYDRGLKMLKDWIETGQVLSQTEVVGLVDLPDMHHAGIEAHCTLPTIGDSMKQTLPAAQALVEGLAIETIGPPAALYHKVDLKTQACHYTAVFPTAAPVPSDQLKADQQAGTQPACKAIKIVHTGSYHHLGNAWATAMTYLRHHKLKPHKQAVGREVYPTDPTQTPTEAWVTEVLVPVRG